jgi:hypothetical protein
MRNSPVNRAVILPWHKPAQPKGLRQCCLGRRQIHRRNVAHVACDMGYTRLCDVALTCDEKGRLATMRAACDDSHLCAVRDQFADTIAFADASRIVL